MTQSFDKHHILVVDDDTRLRLLLKDYLSDQGFVVTVAVHAADAKEKLGLFQFDLVILDVMMPGMSGIDFAATLDETAPPILLLTAMADAEDRIRGLEVGADDYLVKPFEPRELVLRMNAILRRVRAPEQRRQTLRFGEYVFDLSTQRLTKNQELFPLTTGESQLLKTLAQHVGESVSREMLVQSLGAGANERTVDVQITRLRKKIEADSSRPVYIQTVRGMGYSLIV